MTIVFGGFIQKDYSILGLILGSPCLVKLPCCEKLSCSWEGVCKMESSEKILILQAQATIKRGLGFRVYFSSQRA